MTTPAPPQPAPPAGPPAPPAPAPPAPAPAPPQPPEPPPGPDDLARVTATLEAERQARKAIEAELAALKATTMSDAEKALAAARAEGKAEAEAVAARRLAAAEFRALATGRLVNPEAALAVIDLAKLLTRTGEPDRKAIAALVDQLATVPEAPPPPGRIPGGVRQPVPTDGDNDWLRRVRRR